MLAFQNNSPWIELNSCAYIFFLFSLKHGYSLRYEKLRKTKQIKSKQKPLFNEHKWAKRLLKFKSTNQIA